VNKRILEKAFREWKAGRDTQGRFYASVVHWTLIQAFISSDAGCMQMAKMVGK